MADAGAESGLIGVLMDASPIAMIMADRDGRIRLVNTQAERIFGYSREELLALAVDDLVPGHVRPQHPRLREAFLAHPEPRPMGAGRDLYGVRKSGREIPVEIGLSPVQVGEEQLVVAAIIEITERKRLEAELLARADERLREMATHDVLTGLPNRVLLEELLETRFQEASAQGRRAGVLVVSVEGIGRANDAFGRRVGDKILAAIADRIRTAVPEGWIVGRLAAGRYIVSGFDPADTPGDDPEVLTLLEAISGPVEVEGLAIQPGIETGVAIFPDDGTEPAQLLQKVELAMRRGRASGLGGVPRFAAEMAEESRARAALEAALPEAIENGDLRLVFQPQVDLATGRTVSVETLVRWERNGIAVSPAEFIPVAEESNLILRIGAWTLLEGCRQIASLPDLPGHAAGLRIAVNVSPRQFLAPGLLELVEGALVESGLPPERLELEITEGMLMRDPQRSTEILNALRKRGVAIAMDDFGTGYSSLAYLTRYHLDTLKIDQSFIRRLLLDKADQAIVDAIIGMARSLGITVLAEGVETEAQADYLRAHGCDLGQGFLFSRGIPLGELEPFLGNLPG